MTQTSVNVRCSNAKGGWECTSPRWIWNAQMCNVEKPTLCTSIASVNTKCALLMSLRNKVNKTLLIETFNVREYYYFGQVTKLYVITRLCVLLSPIIRDIFEIIFYNVAILKKKRLFRSGNNVFFSEIA